MQSFNSLRSRVIPLAMDNVDTDMIIPAQYLTKVDKTGYGEHVFQRLREQDAGFVFNDPAYAKASILLAGENFGCGSSREHAVWALLQAGVRVVIAKSFSDIFYNNAAKNGLLLISLDNAVIDALLVESHAELQVDLPSQTVTTEHGTTHAFAFDAFRKSCFLQGQDDIAYLLEATQ